MCLPSERVLDAGSLSPFPIEKMDQFRLTLCKKLGSGPAGKSIKQSNYLKVKRKEKKKIDIVSSILPVYVGLQISFELKKKKIFLGPKNKIPQYPSGNPSNSGLGVNSGVHYFSFENIYRNHSN